MHSWVVATRTPSDKPRQNVLFTVCALNELFFIALYLLSFSSPRLSPSLLTRAIPDLAKPDTPTLFTSPWSAGAMEMARANKMDSTIPWTLAIVSSPVMAFKQFTNIVQLVYASQWLAEGDIADRKRLGLPAKMPGQPANGRAK